jgi:hypothetical protein
VRFCHRRFHNAPLMLKKLTPRNKSGSKSTTTHPPDMNPRALEIMRVALEKISAIHRTTGAPVQDHDPEELLEKLDFAVTTAREALDRAAMPGESLN